MNHYIAVRLTGPAFSCVVWLPCSDEAPGTNRIDAVVRDVTEAIRRVAPEMLDDIRVSEPIVWSSVD